MKPTERTLKYLRDRGYRADMIERWIRNPKHPAGGFRKDYFGFGDILAFSDTHTILVQSCGSAFSQHRSDMLANEVILEWVAMSARKAWLIGWRKLKLKRGGKALRWRPRVAEFYDHNGILNCQELEED